MVAGLPDAQHLGPVRESALVDACYRAKEGAGDV